VGTVFINYRRGETAGEARALFNELASVIGKDAVFMDVDNIALGHDFRRVLEERLASCDLMLALIGRDWLQGKDLSGQRRLAAANDFVSLEIEAALKRNIPITPVLVQGAQMPAAEALPEKIRDFAFRNGFELSHNRWESDVQEMFKRLGLRKESDAKASRELEKRPALEPAENLADDAPHDSRRQSAAQPAARKPSFAILGAVLGAIAVAAGVFLYYRMDAAEKARLVEDAKQSAKAKADAESELAAARAAAEKARADAESARQVREQSAAESAKAAAAQAEKERMAAAEQAKRDEAAAQARRDQAAAQAKREQAAAQAKRDEAAAQAKRDEAAAQAKRDEAAAQAKREQAAEAEKARAAAAQEAKSREEAAVQARKDRMALENAQILKASGSIAVAMGDLARSRGLNQSQLTVTNTMGACDGWARELRIPTDDERRAFRAVCMGLADYANANGLQLGRVPSPQEWMRFCMARSAGDDRMTTICLKHR
jgi:hypothetical protein